MSESTNHKGYTIDVWRDEFPENPRECFDNLATLACFHRRYNLGDKDHGYRSEDYHSWDEMESAIVRDHDPVFIERVFLYDHSGLYLKIGDWHGLLPQGHAEFDSGCVGFVFVPRKTALEEYGQKRITKRIRKTAERVARGEVEEYADYLAGNVWGYTVKDKAGSEVERVGGYYGDPDKYLMADAKAAIDCDRARKLKAHAEKLKGYMRNHVGLEHREPSPVHA